MFPHGAIFIVIPVCVRYILFFSLFQSHIAYYLRITPNNA